MAYALLAVVAFPTVFWAAVLGIVVAQAHSDPWPFAIILAAGSVLGLGATFVSGMVLLRPAGDRWGCLSHCAVLVSLGIGPAIAALVAAIVAQWW